MAAIVAFGCSSAAAIDASTSATRSSTGDPGVGGWTSTSETAPVVRVPVLSVARTVTRASVSTAASCCTSTWLRPSRITATAWARLSSSTRPCGTRATTPATDPTSESRHDSSSPTQRDEEQQRRHRHDEPRDDLQDAVDATGQLRAWRVVAPGLARQAGGVGVVADRRGAGPTRSRHDEAARHQLVAGGLGHGVGLAGEQRLVDGHPAGGDHLGIDGDLVAGTDLEHVVEHHVGGCEVDGLSVAPHPHRRRAHQRQPVERALRAPLLRRPDHRVGDHHEGEQGVAEVSEHDDDRAERRPRWR